MRRLLLPIRSLRFLLVLGAGVSSSAAQPGPWTALDGPEAARLVAAAVSGDGTPFVVSDLVIHRRRGGGEWEDVADTFTGSFLDVAGAPGREAWAATGGVFHVRANGTWEWFPVRTGHEGLPLGVVRVAVGPDGTVYVTGLSAGGGGEIQEGGFRSTDVGQSWPEMDVAPLAMAFAGTTAHAGTHDGVFVSADRGASWNPAGLPGQVVVALAASGTRLAAATDGALWTSPDGMTWSPAASLGDVAALAASDGNVVWAAASDGLYRSAGDGASWPVEPAFFAGRRVNDVAATGETVLAVVERVPFLSSDGGQTWAEVAEGLRLRNATALLAANGVLAAGANGSGPFRSTDGGSTWAPWTDGLASLTTRTFVADVAAGRAFLQTHDALYRAPLDGSSGWTRLVYPGTQPLGIAFDSGRFFATVGTASGERHLIRSPDGGLTWTVAFADPSRFLGAPAAGGGVVALPVGDFTSLRLLVSPDGGQTWLDRPHPTAEPFGGTPPTFVDGAGTIYVGDTASSRLRRSADLGATWQTLGPLSSADVRPLALFAEAGVLCVGASGGVFCSTDGGATFVPANAGLPTSEENGRDVIGLARDGSQYVALMDDEGLFASAAATAADPSAPGNVFALSRPLPNPSAGSVDFTFRLSAAQSVCVEVFDVLGTRAALLYEGTPPAGETVRVRMDGRALASGVYLVRLLGESVSATQRVTLLK